MVARGFMQFQKQGTGVFLFFSSLQMFHHVILLQREMQFLYFFLMQPVIIVSLAKFSAVEFRVTKSLSIQSVDIQDFTFN